MKFIKFILLGLLSFVAVILVAGLFVNKNISVTKTVEISRPKDSVFNYVQYLKNQDNYSKWASMDTAMERKFSGTDATPGFLSEWKSKKAEVGEGAQEIKAIKQGERIDYEIRFKEPQPSVASSYMSTTAMGTNKTLVTWSITFNMQYPFNVLNIFGNIENTIGDDLNTGLTNLKKLLEK